MAVSSGGDFRVGEWLVRPQLGRIERRGETVHITPRAMAVLVYLANSAGRVVSRNELLDAVWPRMDVTPDALSQCIVELRKAFRDDSKNATVIETIRKLGVRIVASVAPAEPAPTEEDPTREHPDAAMARFEVARSRRAAVRAITGVAAVSTMAAIGVFWLPHARDSSQSRVMSTARQRSISGKRNEQALVFYRRGEEYFKRSNNRLEDLPLAQRLYEQAIAEDPDFAEAYARLGIIHTAFYFYDLDRTSARCVAAEGAIRTAFALDPEVPEAHLAWANYLYRCLGELDEALAAFAKAEKLNSNDANLYLFRSSVYRKRGLLTLAIADLERAIELDSLNVLYLRQQHVNFVIIRDYARADEYLDRILKLAPDDATTYIDKASLALLRAGDTSLAHQFERAPPTADYASGISHASVHWLAAVYDRDYARALDILVAAPGDLLRTQNTLRTKALFIARTYGLEGNAPESRAYYQRALSEIDARLNAVGERTLGPQILLDLAEAQAALGDATGARDSLAHARARDTGNTLGQAPSGEIDVLLSVLLPLGDVDETFGGLDAYFDAPGAWSVEGIAGDPRLEPLLDDPRWVALRAKYARQ